MAKLSLQLKLGQQLTMTPQLQQAIRLLQMPVLELNTQLQEILESNVMLEQEEPAAEAIEQGQDVVAAEDGDTGWEDLYRTTRQNDPWSGDDGRQPELADRSAESLREHLLWQLEMENFGPREEVIGEAIIDSIDDDGYLAEPLDEIMPSLPQEAGFEMSEAEAVLERIQAFDPAGVGARNPAECIGIQLSQLDESEPGRAVAVKIATIGLDLVAEHSDDVLRRRLSVSDEELNVALGLIRACHPRPGSVINSEKAQYVVPDVYVRKLDGRWAVEVNRSVAPSVRVNQAYADMLRSSGGHANLRSQLQEARWLVRSLEIRHETLLKVAMCIVERQTAFLEHGEEAMKPMILRDIAEAVEMHESTISRVTSNKFMHTPRGVIELRYFFSSQLSGMDGSEQSSTAIRARIKRLVGQENPQKPLSDSKITQMLEEEGIKVARRTVAKYREAMRIPPSSERRESRPR